MMFDKDDGCCSLALSDDRCDWCRVPSDGYDVVRASSHLSATTSNRETYRRIKCSQTPSDRVSRSKWPFICGSEWPTLRARWEVNNTKAVKNKDSFFYNSLPLPGTKLRSQQPVFRFTIKCPLLVHYYLTKLPKAIVLLVWKVSLPLSVAAMIPSSTRFYDEGVPVSVYERDKDTKRNQKTGSHPVARRTKSTIACASRSVGFLRRKTPCVNKRQDGNIRHRQRKDWIDCR
jgi:hypothetical protein